MLSRMDWRHLCASESQRIAWPYRWRRLSLILTPRCRMPLTPSLGILWRRHSDDRQRVRQKTIGTTKKCRHPFSPPPLLTNWVCLCRWEGRGEQGGTRCMNFLLDGGWKKRIRQHSRGRDEGTTISFSHKTFVNCPRSMSTGWRVMFWKGAQSCCLESVFVVYLKGCQKQSQHSFINELFTTRGI